MNTAASLSQAPPASAMSDLRAIRLREYKRKADARIGAPNIEVAKAYFTPSLREICASTLAEHFEEITAIDAMKEYDKDLYDTIIEQLSTDLPLTCSIPRVINDAYWRRVCESRWSSGQLAQHTGGFVAPSLISRDNGDGRWVRIFAQRYVEEALLSLEGPDMKEHEHAAIVALLELLGKYVQTLRIVDQRCHFKVSEILGLPSVHNLSSLTLTYNTIDVGIRFKMNMVGMRQDDVVQIQNILISMPNIKELALPRNRIDGDLLRMICIGLVKNNTLSHLDLSHNSIDDDGMKALAVILMSDSCALKFLDVSDNSIRVDGATLLGRALGKEFCLSRLEELNISMNRFDDLGGSRFFRGLCGNQSLRRLNVSHNSLGEKSAKAIFACFEQGTLALEFFGIAGNKFVTEIAGKTIAMALTHFCSTLIEVYTRNCGISAAEEEQIQEFCRSGRKKILGARLVAENQKITKNVETLTCIKMKKTLMAT